MAFTTIVSGIFAIAKAVPVVAKYIDKFIYMYLDSKINRELKYIYSYQEKRRSILKAISEAKSDAERNKLSVVYSDYDKLSNGNGKRNR